MKLKILLAPLLIVLSAVLLIWFVYPAYTNETDGGGVKEKMAKLEAEKEKLSGLDKKIANAENLARELEASSAEKEVLFTYLPETQKEEELIDNLNYLASSGELSVSKISVSQPKPSAAAPAVSVPEDSLDKANPESGQTASAPKPSARIFPVEFSVVGKYDKIKSVMEKAYRLKRFNKVGSLKITKPKKEDSGDNLEMTAVLEFNFFEKAKKLADAESPVFSKSSFDKRAIDKIKEAVSEDMLELKVDQKGKGNPFFP